jgi:hypothetical protein
MVYVVRSMSEECKAVAYIISHEDPCWESEVFNFSLKPSSLVLF